MRRPFAVFILLLISITAIIYAAGMELVHHAVRQTRADLEVLENERNQEEAAGLAEIGAAVQGIYTQVGSDDAPLTRADWALLRIARAFCERIIERTAPQPVSGEFLASVYLQLGRVTYLLRQIDRSEAAFHQARQLFEQVATTAPHADTLLAFADTTNALCYLLAETGRMREAERYAAESVNQSEKVWALEPGNLHSLWLFALASRNLGLIQESLGKDGVPAIEHAVVVLSDLDSALPEDPTFFDLVIPAFLVDSRQVLCELLLRQRRLDDAEAACVRCVQDVERLEALGTSLSSRDGTVVPLRRYETVRTQLQNNLRMVRGFKQTSSLTDAPFPGSSSPTPMGWRWDPLSRLPGRALHSELLVQGKLSAEFEHQEALMLIWPDEDWCHETLVAIIAAASPNMPIVLLVGTDALHEEAVTCLRAANIALDRIRFTHLPTDTLWVRDYGPLVIQSNDGLFRMMDPLYWNDSMKPRLNDDYLPRAVAKAFSMPIVGTPVFLEAGALMTNGAGLCLASQSLLQKNIQYGLTESHVTATLKRLTGSEQIIYLDPLIGEPTGHVDWFATFTSADTLVIGDYTGLDDQNAELLDRHAKQLAGLTTSAGPLKVVRIPMPPSGKQFFGGTYTNVVFANGSLLVPSWPEATAECERDALDVYRRLLPDWKIVPIDCHELGLRSGALHCAVMNLSRISGITR